MAQPGDNPPSIVADPPPINTAPLAQRNLMKGHCPKGRREHHDQIWRQPWQWYWSFQHLGVIRAEAAFVPTAVWARRHDSNSHIRWAFAKHPKPQRSLDLCRIQLLGNVPAPGHRALRDKPVYDHIVRNICGGLGNTFVFNNMNDLHWFLQHCRTRGPSFLRLIRHVQVHDITSGPNVNRTINAIRLLSRCTGLRELQLELCRNCREYDANQQVLHEWMQFRHQLNGNAGKLVVIPRRGRDAHMCRTCSQRNNAARIAAQMARERRNRRKFMSTLPAVLRDAILS